MTGNAPASGGPGLVVAAGIVAELGLRARCRTAGDRLFVRRQHPHQRARAFEEGAAPKRLAALHLSRHLRADQPRAVARRAAAGRPGEQDPLAAARPLQDRRARQGRRRQDDRRGQRRLDLRRAAPGRPRGGHRRRHRVRQARQPRIDPNAAGSYWELAADEHLDTFADVRSRVGNNAAGLFVLAGETSPPRGGVCSTRRSTAKPPRGWTAISRSRSSTAAPRLDSRSPRRCCAISTR